MQRAEHLNVQIRDLLEEILHLHAVFADDVRIVPARLLEIVAVKIHLVGEDRAVERAENAEGVRGEERVRALVVGHHDLRPVDHRGKIERELVRAGGEHVAFPDELHVLHGVLAEKLRDHHGGLVVADDRGFRVAQQQLRERGGVVRLHVVYDHIVERPPAELVLQIFKEGAAHGLIDRVKEDGLLVREKIGVIGNARRNGIYALKHGETAVVRADPDKIRRNFFCAVHILPPY